MGRLFYEENREVFLVPGKSSLHRKIRNIEVRLRGRKTAFLVNLCVALGSGVLSIFSPTFAVFAFLRTLTGSTMPSNFQMPYIITVEQVGSKQRAWLVCISWTLWTLGACCLALVAYAPPMTPLQVDYTSPWHDRQRIGVLYNRPGFDSHEQPTSYRVVDSLVVKASDSRPEGLDNLVALHFKYDQARRKFVEWAQNEIAVVPDFHKRILFSDEAHFWLNGYVNKQNCRIWSETNPQVYVETPLHPEKLTVWCALWAGGILLQKR
ncbi:organic cation transporter 1 [Trichonephila clavipes]|nr:organic cation transporter 1 [Trichonephila clavipes]